MAVIYRMGSEAPPGVFHAPGNPDIIPSAAPPPPPPGGVLKFGTTLFGQSYARYKEPTLGSGSPRYNAVENDTTATVAGTTYSGGAVTRIYGPDTGPATWTTAHPAYVRADQPVIYSYKIVRGTAQATVKTDLRTFLDSKGTTTAFMWFCIWHEPDDNWKLDPTLFTEWLNWNLWTRQVLGEAAYSARTDYRFGMITTGSPWGATVNPNMTTGNKGWRAIYDGMTAVRGGTDTWDFMGMDRYNPGWRGAARYMQYADWATRAQQMHSETGLPMVIGECGTPRATTFPIGWTIAQRDVERAGEWRKMCDGILADGFYDCASWWRVPALAKGGGISGEFSTIMITPTGYNATLGATAPPGGTDAQAVVDVHAEYCVKSALSANPPISLQ